MSWWFSVQPSHVWKWTAHSERWNMMTYQCWKRSRTMCLGLTLKSLPLASGLNTTWAQPKNWKTTRFATMRCYYGHNSIHETSSWPTFDQRASEWRSGACGMAFMGIAMVITTITLDRACLAMLKQSETSPLKIHFQPLLLGQLQKPLPRGPLTGLGLASFGKCLEYHCC